MILELFIILAGAALYCKMSCRRLKESCRETICFSEGFNLDRQRELERMMTSLDPEEKMEFNRLLGRTVKLNDGGYDAILSVRQISLREGWQYYYVPELGSDLKFVKVSGVNGLIGKYQANIRV